MMKYTFEKENKTIILAQYKTALYKRDIIVIEIEVLEWASIGHVQNCIKLALGSPNLQSLLKDYPLVKSY